MFAVITDCRLAFTSEWPFTHGTRSCRSQISPSSLSSSLTEQLSGQNLTCSLISDCLLSTPLRRVLLSAHCLAAPGAPSPALLKAGWKVPINFAWAKWEWHGRISQAKWQLKKKIKKKKKKGNPIKYEFKNIFKNLNLRRLSKNMHLLIPNRSESTFQQNMSAAFHFLISKPK